MKFFSKRKDSEILKDKIVYKKNATANNKRLLDLLLQEQKGFCAYTEHYVDVGVDTAEVEHLDATKKYSDDYHNYYAVVRKANLRKIAKDRKNIRYTFFDSLFFQDPVALHSRIGYDGEIYFEKDANDVEARDFIDFLGFNDPEIVRSRIAHVNRLTEIFKAANYDKEQQQNYLSRHKKDLSYVTAIEYCLGLDLKIHYE